MDNQNEARYKMSTNERKQYFKEYYLKSKEEKKDKKPKEIKTPKKRGRPKKVIPPFKITRFEKPITIDW